MITKLTRHVRRSNISHSGITLLRGIKKAENDECVLKELKHIDINSIKNRNSPENFSIWKGDARKFNVNCIKTARI